MILCGADLSQVEARVELLLAAASPEFYGTNVAKDCIRLATAHPADFDIHTWSAAVALGKSESEITDEDGPDGSPSDRQIGKTNMHGFMRGMGAQTMSDGLLAKGYVVTPETCERRLGRLAAKLPAIPDGFFPDVRRQVMRYYGLGTTWGAIWRCDYQRLEEHLYGEAYSYQPVRETVDLINQCGFLPLREAIRLRKLKDFAPDRIPRIHVHGHDSLLVSVHPDDAYGMMLFIERTLGATTRRYYAGELRVPVTYQLGETWKKRYEFKRLPDEKTVRDAAWDCAKHAA